MNLAALQTVTTVSFSEDLEQDSIRVNAQALSGEPRDRVVRFLDHIREIAQKELFASVVSESNFPIGAGIASSASAFAALALAGSRAIGLSLNEKDLSVLARHGSGSACRSIPDGFCEWEKGETDEEAFAHTILPHDQWRLNDLIVLLSDSHKKIGSSAGHRGALTSPYQAARIAGADERLAICRQAILSQDFEALAEISEEDSTLMHAVMMTQRPPLFYWQPASLAVIQAVKTWRANGLPCFTTLDAGPNVHVICPEDAASDVQAKLAGLIPGVHILKSGAGSAARELTSPFSGVS